MSIRLAFFTSKHLKTAKVVLNQSNMCSFVFAKLCGSWETHVILFYDSGADLRLF